MYSPDQPAWARGVINAELASKANSRRLVKFGARMASIKSKPALSFMATAAESLGAVITKMRAHGQDTLPPPYVVTARVTYRTERPDLDPALLLDALQAAGIIDNDRHVRELHAYKTAPNKMDPKVEWEVRSLSDQS